MIAAWSGNMVAVQQKVIAAGAMNWQLFANGGTLAVRHSVFVVLLLAELVDQQSHLA